MTAVQPISLRRSRAFAAIAHWALYMLAFAWITLILVWGGLHFVIVPRIGELRPWLETQATSRLHTPVRIGAVVARSNGLIPSVELRDVRIFDTQGRESLHLPLVLAALSPRSLLSGGFEQLYIDSPSLAVRRSADGQIWIAGLLLASNTSNSGAGLDWLFSQSELAVRHGSVQWVDEQRGVPPLDLKDVDIVLRNRGRTHALRLDADPPQGWGSRLTLMGKFVQPLFNAHRGDWKNWRGTLFGQADALDLASLRDYLDVGADLQQGRGGVRFWADLDRLQVTSATADLALQEVVLKLSPQLEPLGLNRVSGRLHVTVRDDGYDYATQKLAFDTAEGLHWPGGDVRLSLARASATGSAAGALTADQLDLAAIAAIAVRLPLDDALRARISTLAPTGQLEKLRYSWTGPAAQPLGFDASGKVVQLSLASQAQTPAQQLQGDPGVPGVRAADVTFQFNQAEGHVSVGINNGALVFPGIFDKPEVAVSQLSGDVSWKLDGHRISVESSNLRFANADAQGDAHIKWQTTDLPRGAPASMRFPGVLDLQGNLSRAEIVAVPRYMPSVLNRDVREYLQHALLGGTGANVKFRVRGDLARFPFLDSHQGDFRISADLQNATFSYAPALVLPHDSLPWPSLTQLNAQLLLEHDTLQLNAARGLAVPATALWFARTDATISKLYSDPQLVVNAEAHGPLTDALTLVNTSQLGVWTGKALAHAQASGNADIKFKLGLPLEHAEKATVQGTITLAGNDFQLSPEVPRLGRARGVVGFSDTGMVANGLQARALGGDVRIDGGLSVASGPAVASRPVVLRVQGTMTADGLRQATELGTVSRVSRYLTGATPYAVNVSLRNGFPELSINSSLLGMAVSLPAPFGKSADSVVPVHLENTLLRTTPTAAGRAQDQWRLDVGQQTSVVFVRDISGSEPKVVRGSIAFGLTPEEAAPLPASGVTANVHIEALDADAWMKVVGVLGGGNAAEHAPPPSAAMMSYLPSRLALRAGELTVQGRKVTKLLIGAGREDSTWRVNVDASELNGYVEYRQPSGATPGRFYARLAHMTIGQSAEQDMETLLDQQPASIPALDVVVDDLELRGKNLGRVEIQAVNVGAGTPTGEWQLNRFNITTPEATLTATGNWANVPPAAGAVADRAVRARRRTALKFKLDIADSGGLLKRVGMPGVLAKGHGTVEGQVAWLGSPFSPDYAGMSGGFHLNVETGQFLKAEPGIAKLLGVLSLQSLPRRLELDFRDVFSDGFSFDFARGDVTIEDGIARTNNLQMKGVNAAVLMEGQADISKETQLLKVVVIPEINAGSASLLASTINPVVGLTTFLAQVLLRRPLIEANTQEFQIDGTWVDPRVTRVTRK